MLCIGVSQRERSYPTFLPSRPLEGRKARILQNRRPLESRYPPPSPSFPTEPPGCGLDTRKTFGALEGTAEQFPIQDNTLGKWSMPHNASIEARVIKDNEASESSQKSTEFNSTLDECEVCWQRNCVCSTELYGPHSTKKPTEIQNQTDNTKLEQFLKQNTFQPALQVKKDVSDNKAQMYMARKNPFELSQLPPPSVDKAYGFMGLEQTGKKSEEEEEMVNGVSRTFSCIQPRSSSAPFQYRGSTSSRADGNGIFRSKSVLLEVQDSFSRTEAHQHFYKNLQGSSMDLRDNHDTGRKHSFYGFNSYYFHN